MTKGKETVEPQGMEPLSLTVEPEKGAMLNEMARITGYSKAAIIRNSLYETLNAWEQARGAK